MISTYKKYTFTSDTLDVDFLSNLKSVLTKNSWVVDKDDITTNDELYIHNSKNMYFSLKLIKAYNDETKKCLCVHGNTGFDTTLAWDAQPGKFTNLLPLLNIGTGHNTNLDQPRWITNVGSYKYHTSQAYWITMAKEQIVFVNDTNILLIVKFTTNSPEKTDTYSFYLPYFIGSLNLISDTLTGGNAVIPSYFDTYVFFNPLPFLSYQQRVQRKSDFSDTSGSSTPLYTTGILVNDRNVDPLTPFPLTEFCLTNVIAKYYYEFVNIIPTRPTNNYYNSPTYCFESYYINGYNCCYKGWSSSKSIFNFGSVIPYMFNKLTRDVYLQEYFAFINDTSNVCKIFATMPWYLGPTVTKSSNDIMTQDSKKYNVFPVYELLGTTNKSDISMYIPYEDGV